MVSIRMKAGILITIGIVSGIILLVTSTSIVIPTMEANHQRECYYDGGKVTGFLQCTRVHMDYALEPTTVHINLGALDSQSKNPIFPKEMTVVLGKNNTVTWLNTDGPSHFINFEDFAIGPIHQGERQSITFNHTGVYEYFSVDSPSILGSVIVKSDLDENDLENFAVILDEINQEAIIYHKNNDKEKIDEQRILMKDIIKEIANNSFEVKITKVNLENNYFPFLPASELKPVDPESTKPICDFSSSIPVHLQKIPETEMFQLFMEKYSEFPIELYVQDERRHGSAIHYGIYSTSDDGNYSAGTWIHVDSCDNEPSSPYIISCFDSIKKDVMTATTKERVLSSLEHEEFCTVPLDSWHQAVYDYGKVISEQTSNHFQKAETMSKDFETVMKFQNELERFSALSDIVNSMYQDESINAIEKSIQEYNVKYGLIPDKLQELFEQRK